MIHPIHSTGEKRVCPIKGTPFVQAWTDHGMKGCFNKCEQCYPKEYKSVSQRLREIK